ncbi:bile acid:sodium symporter family protein [Lichenihabitans psoromatis]|uniref:bile acid:sodium symporter family protein n=1 Tax=Lichenihabitans psoromatis TaxID=2528642 RepID=UPI001036648D|nr:bile acid:sodium symporter family protein [Lichenihabitans psoromatis]
MTFRSLVTRVTPDPYIAAIVGMVVLATILPAQGVMAPVMTRVTSFAIALLFFIYGARLSREAVVAGLTHWRLQLTVFLSTFLLFPVLGLGMSALMRPIIGAPLALGILFLSTLPSTVQSSIAFTSIGRGNVAAALCSASVSNLVGVVVTPLLVGLLLGTQGGFSADAIGDIALQLFLPFLLGQLLRTWIGPWILRHKSLTSYVDRGSILLVVYTAFSEGVVGGLWHQIDVQDLVILLIANLVLLVLVLVATTVASRALGFSKADEIAIVFCGSKKSLASGLPMANILFASQPHLVGLYVLPLMLFHQVQLMACAALAKRYAARAETDDAGQASAQAAPL